MKTMKKILAFALAGVMALALLTGCGTGGSASHKSIAKAMEDYSRVMINPDITYTSSAALDAKLQELAANPEFKSKIVKKVYNNEKPSSADIPVGFVSAFPNMVVYLYCGKYDKDAGKQAISLNAHSACINTYSDTLPSQANERQIGLITTSFTDTNGEKVKVRFAVVVSNPLPPTTTP